MLGRFLEYSVATPDIRASLDFYLGLGFAQAAVGDAWPYRYAVVTDGRVHVGLHDLGPPSAAATPPPDAVAARAAPMLTFVKPGLLNELGALERHGVEFEISRLGNEVFNELAWFDPSGHLIRLLEARTFSPAKRAPTELSLCGYFVEIGLPAPDPQIAKVYWEEWGFVGMDEFEAELPHVSCTSDSIDIGLYDPAHLKAPALVFESANIGDTLARIQALDWVARGRASRLRQQHGRVLLSAPEGTQILLVAEPKR